MIAEGQIEARLLDDRLNTGMLEIIGKTTCCERGILIASTIPKTALRDLVWMTSKEEEGNFML